MKWNYLPRSSMLSINFIRGPVTFGDDCVTLPGWIISAIKIAINAEMNEVLAKYDTVFNVIRPLTFGFILADTVIRHDKSSGSVKNFKIRKNNSPGYEIKRMASSEKCTGRKVVPANKRNILIFFCLDRRNDFFSYF